MGGSRRRLKRNQAKVRVGVIKRKKTEKARLPLEVTEERPDMQKRLGTSTVWDEEQTLVKNYKQNKLVMDPNRSRCNADAAQQLKSKEEREAVGDGTYSDDDELRAGCNLPRKSGKAAPPRLTTTQRNIIQQLLEKYGDDVKSMVLDTKLNKMQHSAGQLRKLIEGYHHWKGMPEERHDFRGPQKPYKRL